MASWPDIVPRRDLIRSELDAWTIWSVISSRSVRFTGGRRRRYRRWTGRIDRRRGARALRPPVVLFERERFPRFHIGESLLASINDVVARSAPRTSSRRRGSPAKWGATFMTPDGSVERFADFAISDEVPQPQTWQVPRARFDRSAARTRRGMRRRRARTASRAGRVVRSRRRHRPLPRADRCDVAEPSGRTEQTIRALALVDASGRASIIGRPSTCASTNPNLANVALFSHYAGVPRAEGRRAGDIRVVARRDQGWFWLIPISDELMSVGVVLPRSEFQAQPHLAYEALLGRLIAETPPSPALWSRPSGAGRSASSAISRLARSATPAIAG